MMEDFGKTFIRRLGGSYGNGAATLLVGPDNADACAVTMGDPTKCILELKYYAIAQGKLPFLGIPVPNVQRARRARGRR